MVQRFLKIGFSFLCVLRLQRGFHIILALITPNAVYIYVIPVFLKIDYHSIILNSIVNPFLAMC